MADVLNVQSSTSPPTPDGLPNDEPGVNVQDQQQVANETLLIGYKEWWREDAAHSANWRTEAKEDMSFAAGPGQWSDTDRQKLRDQDRPDIVFNRTLTLIRAVCGMEINGRHEVTFLPRGVEDTALNEVLSAGSQWMSDECDAEDEESDAFEYTVITGMGWVEERLDFEENPKGKYIEESINPLEMWWDKSARKKNLVDSRRMWRMRRFALEDAQMLFPGKTYEELNAGWASAMISDTAVKSSEEKRKRDENAGEISIGRKEVQIIQLQYWVREPYHLVSDPQTNTRAEFSDAQMAILQQRAEIIGFTFQSVRLFRRVYKQVFLGSEILSGPMPAPIKGQFSFKCITGELNRATGLWFGFVRFIRDPAMWGNKWLSQTLHILNSTAKGGILAEKDAFEDQRKAEQGYAKPDTITWMKAGALSGQHGPKVMPKPGQGFSQGYMELLQYAVNALRDVSGLNLELLGLRDENQPGILEAQRKQAGMTILATLFDSLRRFRKLVGRSRLFYLQNFFNDGRLVRVTGPEGAKAVALTKDKTAGEFDVIVADAPTSPNQKEANWGIISMLLPAFKDELVKRPDLLVMILEYSPLPERVVAGIRKALEKPPSPDELKAKAIAEATAVSVIDKNQASAAKDNAAAGKANVEGIWDIASAENLLANAEKTHAETGAHHVSSAVEALTPIPHDPPAEQPAAMPAPAGAE